MRCPYCLHDVTKVSDKRDVDDLTRRRRECEKCGKRFTTYERPEIQLIVVKKNGAREPFDRDKVKLGMLKACEKRPVGQDGIDEAVDSIEASLRKLGSEVESKKIGELVMKKLLRLDKVAYLRFASVYRSFDDVKEFEKELKLLRKAV
jgi:transcriptional repressor NrdR